MRRAFWVALGLGAGATGVVVSSRWAKKQGKKVAPQTLAREARGGLLDLGKLVSETIAEGKKGMADRERELRMALDGDRSPGDGADRVDVHRDEPAAS